MMVKQLNNTWMTVGFLYEFNLGQEEWFRIEIDFFIAMAEIENANEMREEEKIRKLCPCQT